MKKLQRVVDRPAVIFAAAIATRLGASVYILTRFFNPQRLFVGNESSRIAAALASGLGFSSPYPHTPVAATAQQPPVYPLILAGVFKVFGIYTVQSAWVIVSLHILAGGFTAVLIYRLGELCFGKTVAIVAGWLWVIPWMFQARSFAVSFTNAYFAALAFCVLLIWLVVAVHNNRGWFLMGAYAGLLLLLQPSFAPVFVVYGICLACSKARSARMWFALVGVLLVLAPWTARNYIVFHRFIPFRDNLGLELWLGNRPGMHGTMDYSLDFPGEDPTNYIRLGETRFMDAKLNEAWQFIAEDPKSFMKRCALRVAEFWYEPYPPAMLLFFALGWVGTALAWKRRFGWLFVTPAIVYPLVYYVTHTYAGYRHPIEPVMILLVAYALVELGTRGKALLQEPGRDSVSTGHMAQS